MFLHTRFKPPFILVGHSGRISKPRTPRLCAGRVSSTPVCGFEQGEGFIKIVAGAQTRTQPFLDIRAKVSSGGERGLFSVAFHPDYKRNGFFFVDYTDLNGDTKVERYHVTADANVADANSAKLILSVAQPYSNHNGGQIAFGPDGRLYVGMGDGGAGGDPHGNGQNARLC
jgi:glucose/arabinose dehydrogenase